MTPISETEETPVPAEATALPGVVTLYSQSWQYLQNNLALVGILSAPFLVVDGVQYLAVTSADPLLSSLLGVINVVALIVYVLLIATALFLITHQAQTPVFAQGFAWAKAHFGSVVWISVLTGLVTWGGFTLLVVPGIIVAGYVAFSQIILATEGKTGLTALLRSRELVFGNWLPVLWRLTGFQLLYFGMIIVIGTIVGLGATLLVGEVYGELIIKLVFTVLGSVGTLLFLHILYELYSALLPTQETTPLVAIPPASTKYTFLGWFGLASLILTILGLSILSSQVEEFVLSKEIQASTAVLMTELKVVQSKATEYYTTASFVGVCNEIKPLISGDREVTCSESINAYALSVKTGDTRYCVDSTGYNKIIYTDLGERTACLDI